MAADRGHLRKNFVIMFIARTVDKYSHSPLVHMGVLYFLPLLKIDVAM